MKSLFESIERSIKFRVRAQMFHKLDLSKISTGISRINSSALASNASTVADFILKIDPQKMCGTLLFHGGHNFPIRKLS